MHQEPGRGITVLFVLPKGQPERLGFTLLDPIQIAAITDQGAGGG